MRFHAPIVASRRKNPFALEHEFQQPGSKRSRSINFSSTRKTSFGFERTAEKNWKQRGKLKIPDWHRFKKKIPEKFPTKRTTTENNEKCFEWTEENPSIIRSYTNTRSAAAFPLKFQSNSNTNRFVYQKRRLQLQLLELHFVMIHISSNNGWVMNICTNLAAFWSIIVNCITKLPIQINGCCHSGNCMSIIKASQAIHYPSWKDTKCLGIWQLICVISCHSPIAGHKNRIRRLAACSARMTILVDRKWTRSWQKMGRKFLIGLIKLRSKQLLSAAFFFLIN